VRICHQLEQPAKQLDAVTAPKSEVRCMLAKLGHECPGILMPTTNGVGHDLANRLGVFSVCKQIRCDPRGACYQETSECPLLVRSQSTLMDTHIQTARVPSTRDSELMGICWEMA